MPERTALYRLYDAGGELLYVGISNQPLIRWKQHANEKAWWPEVARKDTRWYADRAEAAVEEMQAVDAESPRHNKAGPAQILHYMTIRLSPDRFERLRLEAFERRMSMSAVINEALDEHAKTREEK